MQTAQLLVLDTRFLGVRVRPGAPIMKVTVDVLKLSLPSPNFLLSRDRGAVP